MTEHNTTLTLYSTLEAGAIKNAIETRMEVLSVVPTLGAALEYIALKQVAERMAVKVEDSEASGEYVGS